MTPNSTPEQKAGRQAIRSNAANFAFFVNIGLTTVKIGAGLLSGSVGVLSEGIHSGLDLVSASIAFFTIREAGKEADIDHPYGHGKIETLSSLIEALFLVGAAGFIVWEGISRIRSPMALVHPQLAVGITALSMVVSYTAYRHNIVAADKVHSSAIRLNALHFFADVIAGGAVLLGLLIMRITGWLWIDPLIAFAVAAYILVVSAKQVNIALLDLVDASLPREDINQIETVFSQFKDKVIEAHDLRTRRSGGTRLVDFHLTVCKYFTVEESHTICDEIEAEIDQKLNQASVTIHVEPCQEHLAQDCSSYCTRYCAKKESDGG